LDMARVSIGEIASKGRAPLLWAEMNHTLQRRCDGENPGGLGKQVDAIDSRAAKSSPASGNSTALQKKKRKPAQQRTKLLVFTKTAYRRAMIGAFTHKAG